MAYKGRQTEKNAQTLKRPIRPWIVAGLLIVLLFASVMGTIAYMQAHSHTRNTFTVAKLTVEVDETFDKKEKSNVAVKNTGDVSAYLRAAIVVSWKDADGNILSDTPIAEANYSMTMGSGWMQGADGYWYCTTPVASNAESPVLITECRPNGTTIDKHLCVDILTQGVQAVPARAVEELWDVTVAADGTLTPGGEGGTTP